MCVVVGRGERAGGGLLQGKGSREAKKEDEEFAVSASREVEEVKRGEKKRRTNKSKKRQYKVCIITIYHCSAELFCPSLSRTVSLAAVARSVGRRKTLLAPVQT